MPSYLRLQWQGIKASFGLAGMGPVVFKDADIRGCHVSFDAMQRHEERWQRPLNEEVEPLRNVFWIQGLRCWHAVIFIEQVDGLFEHPSSNRGKISESLKPAKPCPSCRAWLRIEERHISVFDRESAHAHIELCTVYTHCTYLPAFLPSFPAACLRGRVRPPPPGLPP